MEGWRDGEEKDVLAPPSSPRPPPEPETTDVKIRFVG